MELLAKRPISTNSADEHWSPPKKPKLYDQQSKSNHAAPGLSTNCTNNLLHQGVVVEESPASPDMSSTSSPESNYRRLSYQGEVAERPGSPDISQLKSPAHTGRKENLVWLAESEPWFRASQLPMSNDCLSSVDYLSYVAQLKKSSMETLKVAQLRGSLMHETNGHDFAENEQFATIKSGKHISDGSGDEFDSKCRDEMSSSPSGSQTCQSTTTLFSRPHCEIFVENEILTAYAKNVAEEIKNCANLTVEIRHLSNVDDVMEQVLDAMRRNILFVVVINEGNQQFDSVTLFILHGSPEEHRNMIIGDAVIHVRRSYAAYISGREASSPASSSVPSASVSQVSVNSVGCMMNPLPPDRNTRRLICLLAADQFLTVSELDEVIAHLVLKRKLLDVSSTAGDFRQDAIDSSFLEEDDASTDMVDALDCTIENENNAKESSTTSISTGVMNATVNTESNANEFKEVAAVCNMDYKGDSASNEKEVLGDSRTIIFKLESKTIGQKRSQGVLDVEHSEGLEKEDLRPVLENKPDTYVEVSEHCVNNQGVDKESSKKGGEVKKLKLDIFAEEKSNQQLLPVTGLLAKNVNSVSKGESVKNTSVTQVSSVFAMCDSVSSVASKPPTQFVPRSALKPNTQGRGSSVSSGLCTSPERSMSKGSIVKLTSTSTAGSTPIISVSTIKVSTSKPQTISVTSTASSSVDVSSTSITSKNQISNISTSGMFRCLDTNNPALSMNQIPTTPAVGVTKTQFTNNSSLVSNQVTGTLATTKNPAATTPAIGAVQKTNTSFLNKIEVITTPAVRGSPSDKSTSLLDKKQQVLGNTRTLVMPNVAKSQITSTPNVAKGQIISSQAIVKSQITSTSNVAKSPITSTPTIVKSQITSTPIVTKSQIISTANVTKCQITSTPAIVKSQITSTPNVTKGQITGTPAIVKSQITSNPAIVKSQITSTSAIIKSQITSTPAIIKSQSQITSTPNVTAAVAKNPITCSPNVKSLVAGSATLNKDGPLVSASNPALQTSVSPTASSHRDAGNSSICKSGFDKRSPPRCGRCNANMFQAGGRDKCPKCGSIEMADRRGIETRCNDCDRVFESRNQYLRHQLSCQRQQWSSRWPVNGIFSDHSFNDEMQSLQDGYSRRTPFMSPSQEAASRRIHLMAPYQQRSYSRPGSFDGGMPQFPEGRPVPMSLPLGRQFKPGMR